MTSETHRFVIQNQNGKSILIGTEEEYKVIRGHIQDDEIIEASQADKLYVQLCECPHCKNRQIYYLEDLVSGRIGEIDSHCYGCEGEVEWKILVTMQMMEVSN